MTSQENIKTILQYMPQSQAQCFIEGLMGTEHQYYEDVANKLANVISSAPSIYETDGQGEDVKPVLHYFYGNMDIYITEIDKSGSNQHFGYTSLGMGYLEAGYIDLEPIFRTVPLLNLDFNYNPETISTYRNKYEVA